MANGTLKARVEKLENDIQDVKDQLSLQISNGYPKKHRWKWFVGIDSNNPHFAEAVRLGEEWRYSDRPIDEKYNE